MSITSTDFEAVVDPPAAARLRPRRTLNRLALALTGLGLGVVAQYFFSQDSVGEGLLFYAAAALLFAWALGHRLGPKTVDAYQTPFGLGLRVGWRRNVGVWLMVLAVGLSGVAFRLFGFEDGQPQAWWLYLASLILLVSGGLLLTAGDSWRVGLTWLLPTPTVALTLLFILGLALVLRLYDFTSQPFGIWYDEAEAGLQARRMLEDSAYRPIFYSPINLTGHLLALYALALYWLGDNVYSLRLVSVLFGLAGVLAAYLFGRELRGPRFGLLLAFLMAVARWPVNFSRIAMTGIDTPFFELLTLFFLLRLSRHGRLRDALGVGLTLGFGLMFYTAFRLFLLALLVFVLATCLLPLFDPAWRNWWRAALQKLAWPGHLGRLALIGVTVWLVVMPVVKFALNDTEAFLYRTNQISIFTRRDQPDLLRALGDSATKHLLMFNVKGDNNGRHNLPGEPMLDPAMAVLGVLGLGLALARLRRPDTLLFLLLLPVALTGGIFSVDFEAPQSLRSIAVIPAALYFVALALAVLGREAEESLKPLPRPWIILPGVALLGFIFFYNASTYFVRQANDFASWNAFSTPETLTGRKMAELGPDYLYFLSPFLANHPTLRFLAPQVVNQHALTLPDPLPIREPPDRPVALLIHPDDQWVFEQAQRYYPNAAFEVASSPTDDISPVVYSVTLQPLDLAAVEGLELTYRPAEVGQASNLTDTVAVGQASSLTNPGGQANQPLPLHTERAYSINADWPHDAPPAPASQLLTAEWNGVLYAPRYGPYSFRLTTPGAGLLEIDGNTLLEGQGEQLTGLPLAQGNHSIRVKAAVAPGQATLAWQPPGQGESLVPAWALFVPPVVNHGLLGTYYPNDRWEGQPALQRIDPFLDMYFHFTPLPRPYTVEWRGSLDVPQSGLYRLGLKAVPEAQLYLDGNLLVATPTPNEYFDAAVTLEAGLHDLVVRYKDNADRSRIHLYWTLPSGQSGPIPAENLWPPLGRYPVRTAPAVEPVKMFSLKLNWLASLGDPGDQPGQFLEPRDVAVLGNGNLVVADTINRRVQLFDPQGTPLASLTGDDLPFEEPLAVAVNSRDEILVLDSTLQWVYRYDSAGNLLNRFGGPSAFLFHPRGLTVFADDSVAVADTGSSRLTFFSADGVPAGSLGGLGSGPGQLNEPTDVLRDAQGAYFVAEAENNRIQRLDAGGNPLTQWAIPDTYGFNGPHLAFGPDGSIFMTESQSRSLLRYAPDGSLLEQWQTIGPVNLAGPVGLYIDLRTNRLYLTDVLTHQVHVFEVVRGSE